MPRGFAGKTASKVFKKKKGSKAYQEKVRKVKERGARKSAQKAAAQNKQ